MREFGEQPGLAQTGLSSDADRLPLPAERLRQPRVQERQFLGAAHKWTQGPCAAPWHARPPLQEAAYGVHRHWGGQPIEREGLAHLALHLILHQCVGGGADQEGVGRGPLLEACRELEGVTRRDVGSLRLVRQRAHHHRPGMQPQANGHVVQLPTDRVRHAQALAELEGRQHGPSGMVLLCHRRPKQRQEAVAGDLSEGALVALHRVLGQR